MRRSLPLVSFLLGTAFIVNIAQAQSDRFVYAITNVENDANWSFLRKLDLQTGQYSQVLLNGNDPSMIAFDAASKKQLASPLTDERFGNIANAAFGTGVAAVAYDSRNNRLYYTPMFIDQLRYVDLKTMKTYYVVNQAFTGMAEKSPDQGNIITRMVIASDGNGYALTNDARHLMQFSTGKKPGIVDLGSLVDDPSNKTISIHNSCSSFGGDMIADDNGNLYVFSARNHVFKVNIESKVATHAGFISGLPATFTINGAAVTDKNQVIVASAIESGTCFTIDTKTWVATPYSVAGTVWHSSDLGNSNLLVSGNKPVVESPAIASRPSLPGSDNVQIFPNPVTNNKFSVQFSSMETGNYTIHVTDVMGREVVQQAVVLTGENQMQNINLTTSASKGVYLVKVLDANKKTIYSTKIIVQ